MVFAAIFCLSMYDVSCYFLIANSRFVCQTQRHCYPTNPLMDELFQCNLSKLHKLLMCIFNCNIRGNRVVK